MEAQQSHGISTLLEAEKEAAKIVQKARDYRTQKLKDARTEAAKEIEQIRLQKEAEFEQFEKKNQGSVSAIQAAVDKDTQIQLAELEKQFKQNQDKVLETLLAKVTEVQPHLHRNLTTNKA